MHIPDGFLSTPVWGTSAGVSLVYLTAVVNYLKKMLQEKLIPIMGVLGAFIFAAQMLNFPVAGGTSGHLLGGVLAAIVLGPYAGSFIIALVLIVQCLIFQDGGLTALGANILNMSIVGTLGGYGIFYLLKEYLLRGSNGGIRASFCYGVAAWASVVLASSACAIELAISNTAPLKIVLPTMVGIHAIIGIGEAVITVICINALKKIRPDLITSGDTI